MRSFRQNATIQQVSFLLFIGWGICSCCYKNSVIIPAKINIKFDGYSFAATDSIKVIYFRSGSNLSAGLTVYSTSYHHLGANNDFTLQDSWSTNEQRMVVISNDRVSITDTLKNFIVETRRPDVSCPPEQCYSSFSIRGKNYESSEVIQLILKP